MSDVERPGDAPAWGTDQDEAEDIEQASENVLAGWPATPVAEPPEAADELESLEPEPEDDSDAGAVGDVPETDEVSSEAPSLVPAEEAPAVPALQPGSETEPVVEPSDASGEHAPGELEIPPGYPVLEGEPRGGRRAVGVVVSRFNGEVTGRLLDSALAELEELGVDAGSITVMPVPGAFELPLAAMALAKTRRFACVVALGCVIRGDTPHFDYVASEAASGLQLAAIETGVPVSFGVLTLDRPDQAEPRYDKGAEAVRTALEMADLFSNLRAAAAR
jgi:6,7-dimethyl-8-ribityllumazine synthase